jgi:hypothetical protein
VLESALLADRPLPAETIVGSVERARDGRLRGWVAAHLAAWSVVAGLDVDWASPSSTTRTRSTRHAGLRSSSARRRSSPVSIAGRKRRVYRVMV